MQSKENIKKMCVAAVLCAIGILIPIISPVKIQLGPMSFTLASHVAVFIAMFISPYVALFVTLGTTAGFLLAGFAPVVVLRALSHIFFVMIGAFILAKRADKHMGKIGSVIMFGVFLSLIHAAGEVLVVTIFYFAGMQINGSFLYAVVGLVGGGTFIHSMIDFVLAVIIWRAVAQVMPIAANYLPAKNRRHSSEK